MEAQYHITAFYKFFPLSEAEISNLQDTLKAFGTEQKLKGLVLIGTEGINGTISGSSEAIAVWKQELENLFGEITFKDSFAKEQPFKRWYVKIRKEIVSLGDTEVIPAGKHNHVSPEEWDRTIDEEDVVILDARNDYETEIGAFEGAVDPKLKTFQEFPEYVRTCDIPKDKKILMYCTGGIRCEKACLEMERQGYSNVYQLDGGILRYIQERPRKKWNGECFVFDHRVAVNQELLPSSKYGLCPHCGDPGDQEISCCYCGAPGKICIRCQKKENRRSCSKNCAHHLILRLKKAAV